MIEQYSGNYTNKLIPGKIDMTLDLAQNPPPEGKRPTLTIIVEKKKKNKNDIIGPFPLSDKNSPT